MPANILVGCGGSGIKTLMRFTELLSQDKEWRYRINNDIYYLLVDTDARDLTSFQANLKTCLGPGLDPYCREILLAKNISNLQPLVEEWFVKPFEDGRDAAAAQRLYEHWWNRGIPKPYKALKVKPLQDGAGQCPPVSYFLAWDKLPQLDQVLEEVVDEINARRHGTTGEEPLAQVNLFVVAGLSGGTGRGCWQMIAFKIRQFLEHRSGASAPQAILFDASVMKDLARPGSDQMRRMSLNALTGMSELSAWNVLAKDKVAYENELAKDKGAQEKAPFEYRLPHMQSPGEPGADVLRFNKGIDDLSVAPVESSFLICDDSDVTSLRANNDYYEMAGTALFAMITESQIRSERINVGKPYASLAAATFEIPSASIRLYFEQLMRQLACEHLANGQRKEEVGTARAEFLKNSRLDLQLQNRAMALMPKEDGTILQQILFQLGQRYANDNRKLLDAARAQDKETVLDMCRKYDQPSASFVKAATAAVMGKYPVPDEMVTREVKGVFRATKSFQCVGEHLAFLVQHLTDTLKALPPTSEVALREERRPRQTAVQAAKSRSWVLFGKYFDEQEIETLGKVVDQQVVAVNYEEVVNQLRSLIAGWQAALVEAQAKLVKLQKVAKKIADRQKGAQKFKHEDLFTDPKKPEAAFEKSIFTRQRFYKNVLCPALSTNDLSDDRKFPELKKWELREAVWNPILEVLDGARSLANEKEERAFLEEIATALEQTIHLDPRFIEERFTLSKVVEGLRDAWEARLREAKGLDRGQALKEILRVQLGIVAEGTSDDAELPEVNDCLLDMCAALATRCRPFWRVRRGSDADHVVKVFPPRCIESSEQTLAGIQNIITKKAGMAVEVQMLPVKQRRANADGSCGNDFLMLAYAYETVDDLDQIDSLKYYDQPAIKKWLERCEDQKGESIFTAENDNKGIGYISPIFVRNAELRKNRWAPWLERALVQEAERNLKTTDALLYALLVPPEDIQARLAALGWELPLVRETERKQLVFARKAYRIREGKPGEDPTCKWKKGALIAQRVFRVFEYLDREENGAIRDRILQERESFWGLLESVCSEKDRKKLLALQQEALAKLGDESDDAQDKATYDKMVNRLNSLLG